MPGKNTSSSSPIVASSKDGKRADKKAACAAATTAPAANVVASSNVAQEAGTSTTLTHRPVKPAVKSAPSKEKKKVSSYLSTETGGSYKLEMPFFSIGANSQGHVVIGGGGGDSKSGIPNGFVLMKWDFKTLKLVKLATCDTDKVAVNTISIHPTEATFVYGSANSIVIYNFGANGFTKTKEAKDVVATGYVSFVKFSRGGDKILVGANDGTIKVFEYPAMKIIGTVLPTDGHEEEIIAGDFTTSGDKFATASRDMTCRIWNLSGGVIKQSHRFEYFGKAKNQRLVFKGLRFTVDGKQLITAISGKMTPTFAAAYDVTTGKLLHSRQLLKNNHSCFALSPDNSYIAVGTPDETVHVYSVNSFSPVMTLKTHDFVVTAVAFSPDSKSVISVGADSLINFNLIEHKVAVDMTLVKLFLIIIAFLCLIYIILRRIEATPSNVVSAPPS